MRVLKYIALSLVVFAIVGGIGWLVAREVLLFVAATKVETALTGLQAITKNSRQYVLACRQKGVGVDEIPVEKLQLRFLDDQTYVTEVLCTHFPSDPILIKKETLPMWVMKAPGSAGIIWSDAASAIELESWGRRRQVGVEGQQIIALGKSVTPTAAAPLGITPESSCRGYGYFCCQPETQQGTGEVYGRATDCPRSCYPSCAARPVILSFTAEPFPDLQTRTIQIQSGDVVTFSAIVSDPTDTTAKNIDIQLDFGDGTKQPIDKNSNQVTHTYTCLQSNCTYTAQVTARDTLHQIDAAQTTLTQLKISVTP